MYLDADQRPEEKRQWLQNRPGRATCIAKPPALSQNGGSSVGVKMKALAGLELCSQFTVHCTTSTPPKPYA